MESSRCIKPNVIAFLNKNIVDNAIIPNIMMTNLPQLANKFTIINHTAIISSPIMNSNFKFNMNLDKLPVIDESDINLHKIYSTIVEVDDTKPADIFDHKTDDTYLLMDYNGNHEDDIIKLLSGHQGPADFIAPYCKNIKTVSRMSTNKWYIYDDEKNIVVSYQKRLCEK